MSRAVLRWIGLAFWLAAAASAWRLAATDSRPAAAEHRTSVSDYLIGLRRELTLVDATALARRHDPLFVRGSGGGWSQIGFVTATARGRSPPTVHVEWYGRDTDPADFRFELHHSRGTVEEVLATMLPAEKRARIRQLLADAFADHADELTAKFGPLVEESMRASLPLIEKSFRASLDRHGDEVDRLADRFRHEVVQERLIPLARREMLPVVLEHGGPPAEEIGRELWDRASLWRFGWRAVYDRSPLPKRDLVHQEWDRFVEEEAVPVLESRMDDVVTALQRTLADVAANPAVRGELADVAKQLARDRQVEALTRTVLKETFVENEALKERWKQIWSGERARAAYSLAAKRAEPVIRRIGDELFGSRQSGIDPNFARVLRHQILGKDRRWLVAVPRTPSPSRPMNLTTETAERDAMRPTITPARVRMTYPVVHLAGRSGEAEP